MRAASAPGTAAERHYAWDKAGAPVGIDDLIWGKTRYTYEANGQVAEASFGDGFTERFEYDAAKNVAAVRLSSSETRPGLELGGLLAWRSTPGGVVQIARCLNGEMVALTHDVGGRVVQRRIDRRGFRPKTWRYGWDVLDRLVTCETPDGDTWFYRYDPFGRRLTKVRKLREAQLAWTAQKYGTLVPADERQKTKIWTWPEVPDGAGRPGDNRPPIVGTQFTWDGDVLAEETPLRLDGSSDWESANRWHFEPGGFRPLAKQTNKTLSHIINDHLGTPLELIDESGELRWAANLSTWGAVRAVRKSLQSTIGTGKALYAREARVAETGEVDVLTGAALIDCPIRFQGQWEDQETGLYYNLRRYFDPLSHQYCSVDPIGLDGGARPHGYVINPTRWCDPLGLEAAAAGPAAQSIIHKHHIFPQEFGPYFSSKNIVIDRYTVPLERGIHLKGVHGKGTDNLPGDYNDMWDHFIQNNPNASTQDVFNYGQALSDRYGFGGLPVVPYK